MKSHCTLREQRNLSLSISAMSVGLVSGYYGGSSAVVEPGGTVGGVSPLGEVPISTAAAPMSAAPTYLMADMLPIFVEWDN